MLCQSKSGVRCVYQKAACQRVGTHLKQTSQNVLLGIMKKSIRPFPINIKSLQGDQYYQQQGNQRVILSGLLVVLQTMQIVTVFLAAGCSTVTLRDYIKNGDNTTTLQSKSVTTQQKETVNTQQIAQYKTLLHKPEIVQQPLLLIAIICSAGIAYVKEALQKREWINLVGLVQSQRDSNMQTTDDKIRNKIIKDTIRVKLINSELKVCKQQLGTLSESVQQGLNKVVQQQYLSTGRLDGVEESINRLSQAVARQVQILQYVQQQMQQLKEQVKKVKL
eukprot:TRINITY_DN14397_c0_g1_i1.p1 TRINITY_DN14397_c0_g1~~TRINITY_DN14397_c0_g1_i1.p1  ORF type:complete len:277 (+),score=3.26 TRINITY_DN14397_c0_g1_i1:46-876(+)